MTLTRIIGDIHGNKYEYELISSLSLNTDISGSIQVGDFGVGLAGGDYWHESVNSFMADNNARMIRGNHDKPSTCKAAMTGCIPDGTVEGDIMYIGGAWSIDWQYRTEGFDWWRDEELSYKELDDIISVYETVKPRVMITHDCPTLAAYHMFIKDGNSIGGKTLHLTRTGEALQQMFEIHQPEFHFFGHWHHTKKMKIEGTEFQCIGELDFVDVEL